MHHQTNPFLAADRWQGNKGDTRTVETPGAVRNIILQTRGGALTAFEDRFADALMQVFGQGAEKLSDVVAGLNALPCNDPDGRPWTGESLTARLHQLGDALFAPEAIPAMEATHG